MFSISPTEKEVLLKEFRKLPFEQYIKLTNINDEYKKLITKNQYYDSCHSDKNDNLLKTNDIDVLRYILSEYDRTLRLNGNDGEKSISTLENYRPFSSLCRVNKCEYPSMFYVIRKIIGNAIEEDECIKFKVLDLLKEMNMFKYVPHFMINRGILCESGNIKLHEWIHSNLKEVFIIKSKVSGEIVNNEYFGMFSDHILRKQFNKENLHVCSWYMNKYTICPNNVWGFGDQWVPVALRDICEHNSVEMAYYGDVVWFVRRFNISRSDFTKYMGDLDLNKMSHYWKVNFNNTIDNVNPKKSFLKTNIFDIN